MDATSDLANLRDVGGLPTTDGGVLRHGVLLRSDAPHPGDATPPLPAWPPSTVLDLRSPDELDEPHPLAIGGARVISVPLAAEARTQDIAARYPDLPTLYGDIVGTRGELVAEAVGHIARARGPVLVHCAAGKDRTGIVVAVLLAALGVEREAIVEDYHRTERNMPGVLARVTDDPAAMDDLMRLVSDRPDLVRAPRAAIEDVLDVLGATPGGAAGWLLAHGVDDDDFARLRARLLEA